MYDTATALDVIGRILMAGFFVVTAILNISKAQVKNHVDRLIAGGTPYPTAVFWIGIVMELIGAALVLSGWNARAGVVLLIVFTIIASLLFLRFWQQPDPMRRVIMRNGMLANVAIVGGLLLLLQHVS
ncbi:MAG TPA: DoxX family protein [Stellaceae bacterium]|nr:DoxX family protein [Stellaceae bacterium]